GLQRRSHPGRGPYGSLVGSRDASVLEVVNAERRNNDEVRSAGLICKVEKRINKAGKQWPIATIEDLDASIEALFFPKTYPLYVDALVEDTAVTVKGRLNDREGTYSIFVSE